MIKIFESFFLLNILVQPKNLSVFLTLCLPIIEKAQASTSQNMSLLNEALYASLLMATYLNSDISLGNQLISE